MGFFGNGKHNSDEFITLQNKYRNDVNGKKSYNNSKRHFGAK